MIKILGFLKFYGLINKVANRLHEIFLYCDYVSGRFATPLSMKMWLFLVLKVSSGETLS